LFIVYHDHMHGALLKNSPVVRPVMALYGMLVLAPPKVWRDTHNYHHAHTAKIIGSNIGSFPMVTTEMWREMTPSQRRLYKIVRHPLTILFGYVPLFMYGMCLASFLRAPRKYPDSLAALVLHFSLVIGVGVVFGAQMALFTVVLPLIVACAAGGYLFYAQHNFPEIYVASRQEWTYTNAALQSSSYMKLGPVMSWFTGNIGYHHVHHLNSSIPFYRLPDAMAAIPELQHPGVTSLSPTDIAKCLSLKLWDPDSKRMVGYPKLT
jgi:omega-6 fatty acid desaturase (delta-12 desaturase)